MIFSNLTFRPGALVVGEPPLASGNSSAPVSGGAAASAALWVLGCGRFVRVYTGDEESRAPEGRHSRMAASDYGHSRATKRSRIKAQNGRIRSHSRPTRSPIPKHDLQRIL